MISDPTLEQMKQALTEATPPSLRDETWGDDCLIAIYYFAAHHYNGQGSNLYKAVCAIGYNPKCLELEDEGQGVQNAYETLAHAFAWKK